MVEFSRPAWLLLAAALPWFWWHARSGARPISGKAASVRVLVAALLILAAAGTRVAMSEGDVSVVYVLDRSASMSARAQSRAPWP